jgi:hypothetical protein
MWHRRESNRRQPAWRPDATEERVRRLDDTGEVNDESTKQNSTTPTGTRTRERRLAKSELGKARAMERWIRRAGARRGPMETMSGERTAAACCWGKRRTQESSTARDHGELELGTRRWGLEQGRRAGKKTTQGRAETRAAARMELGHEAGRERRRPGDGQSGGHHGAVQGGRVEDGVAGARRPSWAAATERKQELSGALEAGRSAMGEGDPSRGASGAAMEPRTSSSRGGR